MDFLKDKKGSGFTLIELLVVISIIALLSSIVLSSLSSARMKARDTKRIQDLKQIQIALEMYRNDNGTYPKSDLCADGADRWCQSNNNFTWTKLENILKDKYISQLPKDPKNIGSDPWTITGDNYVYAYASGRSFGSCKNGNCYDLVARLEDTSNPLRCNLKKYYWFNNNSSWCGTYSPQIYSPQTSQ